MHHLIKSAAAISPDLWRWVLDSRAVVRKIKRRRSRSSQFDGCVSIAMNFQVYALYQEELRDMKNSRIFDLLHKYDTFPSWEWLTIKSATFYSSSLYLQRKQFGKVDLGIKQVNSQSTANARGEWWRSFPPSLPGTPWKLDNSPRTYDQDFNFPRDLMATDFLPNSC